MHDIDGAFILTFYCGDLPADEATSAAGHEPNGYFWERLVQYVAPELVEQLDLDSEAGMFAAYGDRVALEQLRTMTDPSVDDGRIVAEAIHSAEASGFQFDD